MLSFSDQPTNCIIEGDMTLCPASNVRGSAFRLLGKEMEK